MTTLKKLKLGSISKANMQDREMNKIFGGTYCAWGAENKQANIDQGKCSCYCANGYSYNSELKSWGWADKVDPSYD